MVTTHLDSELQDELCCRGTGHEDESLSPGETEDREEQRTERRQRTERTAAVRTVTRTLVQSSVCSNTELLYIHRKSVETRWCGYGGPEGQPCWFIVSLVRPGPGPRLGPGLVLRVLSCVCLGLGVVCVGGSTQDQDQDQDRYPGQPCDLLQPRPHPGCHGDRSWTRGLALFNAVCLLITVLPCLPRVDAVTLSVLTTPSSLSSPPPPSVQMFPHVRSSSSPPSPAGRPSDPPRPLSPPTTSSSSSPSSEGDLAPLSHRDNHA
ncbi:hypothetical protein INR49_021243, partial [Caranx melampygus]